MEKRKRFLIIFLLIFINFYIYPQSFENNYNKAMESISYGNRINAQKYINRCILYARDTLDYIKLAYIYYSINPKDTKIYEYLLEAFRRISSIYDSLNIAKEYINIFNNKNMAYQSFVRGLNFIRSIDDAILIARESKAILGDTNFINQIINISRKYIKNVSDWIKISDIYFSILEQYKEAEICLDKAFEIAQNKEDLKVIAEAYRHIGLIRKSNIVLNKANLIVW